MALSPFATVGTLNLNGAGNFTMTAFTYQGGKVTTQNGSGTYSISPTCQITLSFTSTPTTPALPTFTGLLTETGENNGLLTLQTSGTVVSTGTIVAQ